MGILFAPQSDICSNIRQQGERVENGWRYDHYAIEKREYRVQSTGWVVGLDFVLKVCTCTLGHSRSGSKFSKSFYTYCMASCWNVGSDLGDFYFGWTRS